MWLTIADLLEERGIDRGTFDRWRRRGVGPLMKRLPDGTWRIRGDWYDAGLADLPEEHPHGAGPLEEEDLGR